jgi:hypothetical protein
MLHFFLDNFWVLQDFKVMLSKVLVSTRSAKLGQVGDDFEELTK